MTTIKEVRISVAPGSHVREAREEAGRIARRLNREVVLVFNDREYKVCPDGKTWMPVADSVR